MLKFAPETKAQGNGLGLGGLLGLIPVYLFGLSFFAYSICLVVSIGLLGLVFAATDHARANAGKAPVGLAALFQRGLLEALGGVALTMAFDLVAQAT